MDKLLETLKCVNCSKMLSSPIALPCGHSVCACHIDQSSQSVMCNHCGVSHTNCSFSVNVLANAIVSQVGTLDFGPTHNEARKSYETLSDLMSQIDVLLKDPDVYIYDMFSEMRRQVDLQYEEYKLKLDREAQAILTELERLEKECKHKAKSCDSSKKLINAKNNAQKDLDSFLNSLNEFKIDENKWKQIQQQCNDNVELLNEKLSNYKELLTTQADMNKLNTEFTVKIDLRTLFEPRLIMDSKIVNNIKLKKDLLKLCEIGSKTKFTLLYRGSRDGFRTQNFGDKCEGKAKTLTIVKSTSECIFGGYAEAKWNFWARDPNAFLFSMINRENRPLKMKVVSQEVYTIAYDYNFAPIFGRGYDLGIANNCNQNTNSYSNLGSSFKHPMYSTDSENAQNFLAGSKKFQVAEIEVFQLD